MFTIDIIKIGTLIFAAIGWVAGIVMLIGVGVLVYDLTQTRHAVLRNFPVIGHLRYFLERQGEYFRQYFFAHDRQELPFDRATRSWIYRTAKGMGGMIGFGSTNDLRVPGAMIFVNSAYPILEEDQVPAPSMVIGPECDKPFAPKEIFNISGMSYGAISGPAVSALSRGAAKAGIWMNTGEGGLSPLHLEGGCDLVFQIGTAKYGVRDEAGRLDKIKLREIAEHAKAFEIKISQGAKPGRGGVLPAIKVTEEVARIRGIPLGKPSSSPNRHVEIKGPNDLLDMIALVREATGRPVGFKVAISSEHFPRELFECILRRGLHTAPDFITVDGGDGGTGAAPQILADYAGLPLSEALPMMVNTLMAAGLHHRIRVVASGKLVTSAQVAWAMCVGADYVTSARGFMFALGCIQSLQCHQDTCPTGVATHNKRLQRGLVVADKAERVASYAYWVNREVDKLAHACGLHNARGFQRKHLRIVQTPYHSVTLEELFPYPASSRLGR